MTFIEALIKTVKQQKSTFGKPLHILASEDSSTEKIQMSQNTSFIEGAGGGGLSSS